MIGVLVVSHGHLGQTLLETAAEIVGPFDAAEALAVDRSDRLDEVRRRFRTAIERLDSGYGVLVLADMFGGTATNIALEHVGEHQIEVVTGCNLPMLLKLSSASKTSDDLIGLAQLLKFYGQRNVLVASEILKEREKDAG